MNRRMVPPQVRPTANASSSLYPNVTMRAGASPARMASASRHDGALDAAAADAAGDLAVLVDGHRCAGFAGAGALDVDHAGDGHARACRLPAVDVVEQFLHPAPLRVAMTAASSSMLRAML